ncbi:MAG: LEA type 2 family protein [Pseudomonadota bacterium]
MLTLSGCGKLLKKPEVHLNSIQIKEIKNLEAVFSVNIEVYNPNFIPFNIKTIECDVEIAGQHIASAVSDEIFSIPAHGTGIVPLEINSNSFDLISVIIKLLMPGSKTGKKQIDYNIQGKILLGGILYGSDTISFSSSGNLLEKYGQLKE